MHIDLVHGDITEQHVDAVVNAANTGLRGGGGVDGAIHRAAGPALAEECAAIRREQGGCPTGGAVLTGAGAMPARYVIHTAGPVWRGGNRNEEQLLGNCYRNALRLAEEQALTSIAFPPQPFGRPAFLAPARSGDVREDRCGYALSSPEQASIQNCRLRGHVGFCKSLYRKEYEKQTSKH